MSIPVEYSFHEDSPSQHEIDLRYDDALSMADSVMTARLVVREIALERGVYATFMPKPLEGVQGSGMHTHLSLFEGDVNAFHDPGDELGLSKVARHFIAGLLHHAPEITAVTNQLVNSYKRLVQGTGTGSQTVFEAPVFVSWGRNNQSALVRVPVVKRGKESSTRIEYRSPDPGLQPLPGLLGAAGRRHEGGRGGLRPARRRSRATSSSSPPRSGPPRACTPCPSRWPTPSTPWSSSDLVAEALGEHVHDWFLRNKRNEWAAYKAQVTPFELERYLPVW